MRYVTCHTLSEMQGINDAGNNTGELRMKRTMIIPSEAVQEMIIDSSVYEFVFIKDCIPVVTVVEPDPESMLGNLKNMLIDYQQGKSI